MFKRDERNPIDLHAHAQDRYAHQTSGGQSSIWPYGGSFPVDKSIRYVKLSGGYDFTALAHIDDGGNAIDVAAGTTHIFVANYADGLRAYTIAGGTFTNVAHYADPGNPKYLNVHINDNGIIFVADTGPNAIRAFSFAGGTFTLLDSVVLGSDAYSVSDDGTYVYMACGNDGLRAYNWVANNLTYRDIIDDGGTAVDVWCHNGFIFLANTTDGLRVYTYDGSEFTNIAHINVGGWATGVWGYGDYIFLANWGTGLHAFDFDGTAFTHLSEIDDGPTGLARKVWGYAGRIFLGNNVDGLRGYNFYNDELTQLAHIDNTTSIRGVHGDSTRIYAACVDDGLRAYTIGAATQHISTITGGETGQLMIIEFQDSLIIMDDDDTHAADTIDLEGTATNLTSVDDMILMIAYNGTSWYQTAPACVN